jgi:beta-glucosidase
MKLSFPEDFVWGTATASYQIEGAVHEDGRGESIWDRFSHTPGKTKNGDTGDVACDHYHRYPEDVHLMSQLGAQAYRFSIAWPRILPNGKGEVKEAGLGYYDRLVDELLHNNIVPYATLYHWDLPQALEDQGGWLNRDTSDYFAQYTDVISRRLGDRVKNWMTFNEPLCVAYTSYVQGVHAPGHRDLTYANAVRVTHNMYLGHGKAVSVLRINGDVGTKVGIALNLIDAQPASDSEEDRAAADRAHGLEYRWFADPIFKGEYPAETLALFGKSAPDNIRQGDMEIISVPLDFLGVNYYTRAIIADNPNSNDIAKTRRLLPPNAEYTTMPWEVYPDGLSELLIRANNDYHPKEIYITENGCSLDDVVDADGMVHDLRRVNYLRTHFKAAHEAIRLGVPLKGYFVWSLMDNFEWSQGYSKRFGIVYTDFETQQRIPKDSYKYYQSVIRVNGVSDT